jgi:serine/threonine-protein kinase
MAKNPDDRFQSISEMMSELRLSQGFVNTNKGAMPIIKNNFSTQKIQPVQEPVKGTKKKNIFGRLLDSISNHSKKSIIIAMLSIFVVAFMWAFFSFGNFWSTENITVPDVTGKQVEIAKNMLTKKNLDVSIKEEESNEVPVGEVIAQTPVGGSVVKAHRKIYLTVSKGNTGSEVLIPDLRGLTLEEAEKKLDEIGLKVGKVTYSTSDNYDNGKIMGQSPLSPTKVEKGTKVNIVICRKSDTESKNKTGDAPNTSGMTLDQAIKALEGAGYTIGTVNNLDASKDASAAKVTAQAGRDGNIIDLTVEYPDKTSSGAASDSNTSQDTSTPHSGTVNISVPAGASSQHVQIVVTDTNGSRVVYDRNQSGGDSITQNVSGTGKTRVKVYINNALVQDQYV